MTLAAPTSAGLAETRRRVLPSGVTGAGRVELPYPVVFERAEGAYLTDVEGRRYVDLHGGYGTAVLGYAHPDVDGAVMAAMRDGHTFVGVAHAHEGALAERLVDLLPEADRVALCGGGGTDALYHAVRLARAVTGRPKLLKVEGGYQGWHGDLGASTSPPLADAGPAGAPATVPNSAGTLAAVTAELLVTGVNDVAALEARFAEHGSEIAALVVEPVLFSAGTIVVDDDYLLAARRLCDEHGALLVFDEILTGFRIRLGGGRTPLGVMPDLATYGKAVANGHVMSLLAGRAELMDELAPSGPVFYSGTFNGHPLSCAAAMATLDALSADGLHDALAATTAGIAGRIEAELAAAGVTGCCQAYGGAFTLYLGTTAVRDYRDLAAVSTPDALAVNDRLRAHLREQGVFMQRRVGTNRCFVSAAHGDAEADAIVAAFASFIHQLGQEA